jgi:predicted HicB family RNase H-like nuclease
MKKFTLRLDENLAKKLELLAKKEKRSINNYLVMLIEEQSQKSIDKKKST